MKEHALFCIDAPRVGEEAAKVTGIGGWCLCSKLIESLEIEVPGPGPRKASYGLCRPDVGAAFSSYPNGQRCGFMLELPAGSLDSRAGLELTLTLTVKGRLGIRQRYFLKTELSSNHIQQVKLWREGQRTAISSPALERKLKKSLERRPGLVVRIDVINKCNLRCVMCRYAEEAFSRQPREVLTAAELDRLLAGIGPYVRSIMLSCGHEPMTSERFPEILSLLAEKYPWMEIELCTNGILMNAEIRRLLIEKGVTHLIVSMDGVTKKTLEKIRIGAEYETIVANVLALRDLKRASASRYPILSMDYAMMTSNIHEAPAFVEASSRMGVRIIDFRLLIPSRILDDPEYFLCNDRARFNYFRNRILEAGKRFGVDIVIPPAFETAEEFSPENVPPVDLSDFESVEPDRAAGKIPVPKLFPRAFRPRRTRGTAFDLFSKKMPNVFCERPFSEITIRDQRWFSPCIWYKVPLAEVGDGRTLSEVFFGDEFKKLRKGMLVPGGDPNCRACPIKRGYLGT